MQEHVDNVHERRTAMLTEVRLQELRLLGRLLGRKNVTKHFSNVHESNRHLQILLTPGPGPITKVWQLRIGD